LYDETGDATIYNLDLDGDHWNIEAIDEHAEVDGWNLTFDYDIGTRGEAPGRKGASNSSRSVH